jgi:hypothetical protein
LGACVSGYRGRENCQQGDGDSGQMGDDSHAFLLMALLAAHTRVGYSVGDIGEEIHSHIS